jgi:hypothetical protein
MGIFTPKRHPNWFAGPLTIVVLAAGIAVTARADENSSPPKLLTHALQLADLNNWPDAEPELRKAEDVFRKSGNRLGLLYAQLGIIRATAQHRNLPETVAQLDDMLATEPLLQTDRHLRLFCLTIRGDFDGEMKSSAMRKDWEEVAQLSKDLGDEKWQNRALAEIGFAAFYDGDIETFAKECANGPSNCDRYARCGRTDQIAVRDRPRAGQRKEVF